MNIPLATTKQFRNAVKQIIPRYKVYGKTYTDRPRINVKTGEKRYVKICASATFRDIENIEFILWTQGVTAHTRHSSNGRDLRGTCIISKKEKE